MADRKITDLPEVTSLEPTDLFHVVRPGETNPVDRNKRASTRTVEQHFSNDDSGQSLEGAVLRQAGETNKGLFISYSGADKSWHLQGTERDGVDPVAAVASTAEYNGTDAANQLELTFADPTNDLTQLRFEPTSTSGQINPSVVNSYVINHQQHANPVVGATASADYGDLRITSVETDSAAGNRDTYNIQVGQEEVDGATATAAFGDLRITSAETDSAGGNSDTYDVQVGQEEVLEANATASIAGTRTGDNTANPVLRVRSPDVADYAHSEYHDDDNDVDLRLQFHERGTSGHSMTIAWYTEWDSSIPNGSGNTEVRVVYASATQLDIEFHFNVNSNLQFDLPSLDDIVAAINAARHNGEQLVTASIIGTGTTNQVRSVSGFDQSSRGDARRAITGTINGWRYTDSSSDTSLALSGGDQTVGGSVTNEAIVKVISSDARTDAVAGVRATATADIGGTGNRRIVATADDEGVAGNNFVLRIHYNGNSLNPGNSGAYNNGTVIVNGTVTLRSIISSFNSVKNTQNLGYSLSTPDGINNTVTFSSSADNINIQLSGGVDPVPGVNPLEASWDDDGQLSITALATDTFAEVITEVATLSNFQAGDGTNEGDVWLDTGTLGTDLITVDSTVGDEIDYTFSGGVDYVAPSTLSVSSADNGNSGEELLITGLLVATTTADVIGAYSGSDFTLTSISGDDTTSLPDVATSGSLTGGVDYVAPSTLSVSSADNGNGGEEFLVTGVLDATTTGDVISAYSGTDFNLRSISNDASTVLPGTAASGNLAGGITTVPRRAASVFFTSYLGGVATYTVRYHGANTDAAQRTTLAEMQTAWDSVGGAIKDPILTAITGDDSVTVDAVPNSPSGGVDYVEGDRIEAIIDADLKRVEIFYNTSIDTLQEMLDALNAQDIVSVSYLYDTDLTQAAEDPPFTKGLFSEAEVNVQADWGESNTGSDAYIRNKPTIPTVSNDFTNSDKTKLDGIETGAEVNVQANWSETDDTEDSYIQNKPTIPTVSNDFTNADKSKLDGIADNAEVNVQADWGETSTSDDSFIQNKPTDAEIGDKAFSNPPSDLDATEQAAVRTAIGAGTGSGTQVALDNYNVNELTHYTTSGQFRTFYNSLDIGDSILIGIETTPTTGGTIAYKSVSGSTYVLGIIGYPTMPTTSAIRIEYADGTRAGSLTQGNLQASAADVDGQGEWFYSDAIPAAGQDVYNRLDDADNVQADWTETSSTSDAFIQNKPTDAQLGNTAFSNPPSDLTSDEQTAVRTAIGAGTGSGASLSDAEVKTAYENNADTNAFTDAEQTKLGGIEAEAEVNVQPNWNETDTTSDAFIQNKPDAVEENIHNLFFEVIGSANFDVISQFNYVAGSTAISLADTQDNDIFGVSIGGEQQVGTGIHIFTGADIDSSATTGTQRTPTIPTFTVGGNHFWIGNDNDRLVFTSNNIAADANPLILYRIGSPSEVNRTRAERITFDAIASTANAANGIPIATDPITVISGSGDPEFLSDVSNADFMLAAGTYLIDIIAEMTGSRNNADCLFYITDTSNNIIDASTTISPDTTARQIGAKLAIVLTVDTEVRIRLRPLHESISIAANWTATFIRWGGGLDTQTTTVQEYDPPELGRHIFNHGTSTSAVQTGITCPATGWIIAVINVPGLGLRGVTNQMLAGDLRAADQDDTLSASLYTDSSNQIILQLDAQATTSTGNSDSILIFHSGTAAR